MDKQPNEPDSPEPTLFDTLSDAQGPQPDSAPLPPTESAITAGESDPASIEPASAGEAQVPDEPLITSVVATPEPSVAPVETVAAPTEASDPLTEPAVAMTDIPAPGPSRQPSDHATTEQPPVVVQEETPAPATVSAAPTADTTMIGEPVPMDSPDTQTSAGLDDGASPNAPTQTSGGELEAQEDRVSSAPVPASSPAEPPLQAASPQRPTGAWWTIPMICVGLAMVACALIVGQVEINRQAAWQRNKLKADLTYLQDQVKQNEEFLKLIQTDPTLAERMAQRQMKQVREGSAILEVPGLPHQNERNPFQLTTIPPPKRLKAYQPNGDLLTSLFADPQHALWAIGIGLMLVAAGLVLGGPDEAAEDRK